MAARARTGGRWAVPMGLGVAVLFAAEVAVNIFRVPPYIVPAPSAIARHLVGDLPTLGRAAIVTTVEAVSGYLIGALLGVAAALATFYVPRLERWILPGMILVNSVPSAALAPLVVLYAGVGPVSKIVVVALVTFFVTYLNVQRGLESVDRGAVSLMQVFGASELAILWKLRAPTALPYLFTALKVSTVRSMLVTIVAEMLGAYAGLGHVIMETSIVMDNVRLWAAVVLGSLVSITFFLMVSLIEKRVVSWRVGLAR